MQLRKGMIVSKNDFQRAGEFTKEEYEGLMVSSDTNSGFYNIGIQLDENQIVVVDQVRDTEVHNRLHDWVPRISQIQREYHTDMDMQNYV